MGHHSTIKFINNVHDYIIRITVTKQINWHTIQHFHLLTTCMTISFLLLEQNSRSNSTLFTNLMY
jgi:hypothetical protein